MKAFRDGFMPYAGAEVKEAFEELKAVSPDLIFTPNRKDAHQDHRLIAELTWNTFRDHMILEYEIPKYDGDFGQPSVFVPLESEVCKKKVQYLTEAFKSQLSKRWFEESTFLSLLRLRGMECSERLCRGFLLPQTDAVNWKLRRLPRRASLTAGGLVSPWVLERHAEPSLPVDKNKSRI